jgi:hypothetical protein
LKIKKMPQFSLSARILLMSILRAGQILSSIRRPSGRLFHAQNREGNAFADRRCGPHWSIAAIYRPTSRTYQLTDSFIVSLPLAIPSPALRYRSGRAQSLLP